MGWNFWGYYKPSRPRAAKGGIKSQSKRGTFGESWWAKRWINVLESFNIGARLGRGRSYARSGQVLSIDIEKGVIDAQVQGSRPKPYKIQIKINPLSTANWQKVGQALSHQAIFAAKLLAGEMPQDVEEVFRSVGVKLFPEKLQDLQTNCSCPDWSNPCKHIAAVYYLLGEEFDRDPFLIFRLRGMEREELVKLLGGQSGPKDTGKRRRASTSEEPVVMEPRPPVEPLPTTADAFWGKGGFAEDRYGEVRIPPVSAAILRRLGSFPFWRGEEGFADALESIYREAASVGLDVFLGERKIGSTA